MKQRLALLLAFIFFTHAALAGPLIFLARHGEKAAGPDPKDPELSHPGQRRAEWIAAQLKDAGISAIFATEFKRTQQTAEPLARATHVNVTVVPADDINALVSKLKETQGNAFVAAHSNTIPEIAKALGVTTAITLGENDYDDLFIISPGSPVGFARLRLPIEGD